MHLLLMKIYDSHLSLHNPVHKRPRTGQGASMYDVRAELKNGAHENMDITRDDVVIDYCSADMVDGV